MLYVFTLFAHSWVRWAVLVAALLTLYTSLVAARHGHAWSPRHDRLLTSLGHLAGMQMLLGLVLILWTSPIASAAWRGGWSAMTSEPTLLVFGLVHPVGMALSLGILRAGSARVARRTHAVDKHRLVARTVGAWLLLVALLVPWPGLPWGRPLARVATTTSSIEAPSVYRTRCASCHGDGGSGDGVAAASLSPRPRDFHDPAWLHATSDERIRAVIVGGGAAVGLSALMPAHADLSPSEVAELVAFIRAGAPR